MTGPPEADEAVTGRRDADDPAAPVFFLSYWRPDPPDSGAGPPPDRFVRRLFDDLAEDVDALIGSLPGRPPGYLDEPGGPGRRRRLLRAAGTCEVFVALLSAPYLTRSGGCAREWDLFSRRRVTRREPAAGVAGGPLVAVLWAPRPGPLPPRVGAVEPFVPARLPEGVRAGYRADGLLGLLRTGKETEYQAVVWRLAQHVVRIRTACRVEPLHRDTEDGLRSSFDRDAG